MKLNCSWFSAKKCVYLPYTQLFFNNDIQDFTPRPLLPCSIWRQIAEKDNFSARYLDGNVLLFAPKSQNSIDPGQQRTGKKYMTRAPHTQSRRKTSESSKSFRTLRTLRERGSQREGDSGRGERECGRWQDLRPRFKAERTPGHIPGPGDLLSSGICRWRVFWARRK